MKEFSISLETTAKTPLYQQIYTALRDAILSGALPKGEKLPSTRFEADFLSCSRSTVELAYEQLLSEGYIEAQPCRGYFVCDISELYHSAKTLLSPQKEEETKEEKSVCQVDFSPNGIDLSSFPYVAMGRILRNLFLYRGEDLLKGSQARGEAALRSAICAYLFQARNVCCAPNQIVIGAGNEYLLLLLGQILGRDHVIAMESPTYLQAYRTFAAMGYEVAQIPLDAEGMQVDKLANTAADIAYVMPSHQFPMGTVMPLKRRLALLSWAAEAPNRYIIEDDYDSEFRYRGKPIPALQGLDAAGQVIYMGTFSRSIAPSLRISYLVLPPALLAAYEKRCGFFACTVPTMMQQAVCTFMEEGYFERNLNRMRGIYKAKHDALLSELKKRPWVKGVRGEHAGLHFLVEVKTEKSEEVLIADCRKAGVGVYGLSEYFPGRERAGENPILLFGFGALTGENMKIGIDLLEKML